MKKGFTLTELMVALAVIAVLSAIMMPIMHKLRPNQDVLMVKRAFNLAQTVVSEMANDPRCYPQLSYDETSVFNNGRGYATCVAYNDPNSTDPNEKFVALFANIANLEQRDGNYYSKDGMEWNFDELELEHDQRTETSCSNYVRINVDTDAEHDKAHDKLIMQVCATGKIAIYDYDYNSDDDYNWVIDAIGVDRRLVGD